MPSFEQNIIKKSHTKAPFILIKIKHKQTQNNATLPLSEIFRSGDFWIMQYYFLFFSTWMLYTSIQ